MKSKFKKQRIIKLGLPTVKEKQIKCFYIHGYNSSGIETTENIKKIGIDIETLQWDSRKDFKENFEVLLEKLKNEKDDFKLVATSLGCYYARALAEEFYCPLTLFNPCFDPENYDFIKEKYDYEFDTSKTVPMSIFVSETDEVLKNNVEKVKNLFGEKCFIEVTNEKHRITDFSKYKEAILFDAGLYMPYCDD